MNEVFRLPVGCGILRAPEQFGFWIMYGENREARRFISDLEVMSQDRGALDEELCEWVRSIHAYEHPESTEELEVLPGGRLLSVSLDGHG